MPENLIFTDKELKFLKELSKNKVRFMIIGLSAAGLQGSPTVTQDIDLWFENLSDPRLKKALGKVGGTYIPPIPEMQNPPRLAGRAVELFDIVTHVHGIGPFNKEIKNTVDVPIGKWTIKVLRLDRIIQSKKSLNRNKDKLVLPVLEDTWKILTSLKKKTRQK